ncbi:hypothetical protein WQ54_08860 [Bacillus sp. SA1-12]|uniref:helix-turn-helix domain-containing protein n=1 Tax=Bacillus sp. SA1-12 TaxID=1455638 RepID=UPI0006260EC9|nr:helix-turn-helix domain-containing protein [Bacillus sp. SA1-12]KKI92476.1 hypothetical protein WQ54_08860 [Bacillus sp. SA1-12]
MKHKPKYFYRIFLPFVLVGTLAMILFNGFAYFFTKDSFEEKIILEKQENVVQTMNTFEQKLQTLDYALNSYVHDSGFKRYINETLTVKNFDTYQSIDKQLNYISSFGPSQTTIDLVSLKGNWVINQNGLKELTKSEKDYITSHYLSLQHPSTWLKEEKVKNEIKLVKQTPYYQSSKNGVLIVHIPLKALTSLLYKQAESSPIYIYSQDGTLIYQSDSDEQAINQKIINDLTHDHQGQTSVIPVDIQGVGQYKVAYAKSGYNGWIYLTKISDSEFSEAMKPTIIGTVLMSVFMLIVTVIIAYVSSDYFSKPIRELQKFIPKMQRNEYRDEFELIGKSIREVMNKNQSLEHIITSQYEQLKTLFMLNLFHGRMNEQEISEQLQAFKYSQNWQYLYVLAIQFDHLDNKNYTRKDKDVLLFSINQLVSEIIGEEEHLTPTVIDSQTQATIFICQNSKTDQHVLVINQYAEKIQKAVKEIFNLTISIGISSPFKRLADSKLALGQGIEALKYRLKVGKESIIFYESVSSIFKNNHIKTYFPKILENQLFDAIKLGENDKAKETLHLLLADLFKNNTNPHELEVNIMRFLNDLISFMHIVGMDTLMIEDHKTLYNAISEMKTSEEIEMFVKHKIVYPMINAITERTDSQYKTISDKIVYIIQNEFDTELSLESIAARLHYNKNYLSSIFKKEFKQSFSEYLALYRYDMAKKWLKETNMSVKEISEKLQYKNSQNFIRSFRKFEGTTPGKYRDLHRGETLSF